MPENSNCSNASSCGKSSCEGCASNQGGSKIQKELPNAGSKIKKVIGVVSGKGGVGKSFVTASLASQMHKAGFQVGILDADITGPSIPKMFGVHGTAFGTDDAIIPLVSKENIPIMSINLLMDDEEQPVIWRGPVIAGAVKQFWEEVVWENEEYLFVDMPPGTGDVPLTVFQSIPLDGIIIVTSPQDLVSMIVSKAVNMANMLHVPIVGVVENYSYFICPDCQNKHYIFGESNLEEVAKQYGLNVLGKLPINPAIAKACDNGQVEEVELEEMNEIAHKVEEFCK